MAEDVAAIAQRTRDVPTATLVGDYLPPYLALKEQGPTATEIVVEPRGQKRSRREEQSAYLVVLSEELSCDRILSWNSSHYLRDCNLGQG